MPEGAVPACDMTRSNELHMGVSNQANAVVFIKICTSTQKEEGLVFSVFNQAISINSNAPFRRLDIFVAVSSAPRSNRFNP